jgi:hypothetical protein
MLQYSNKIIFPKSLRAAAHAISYLLHPIFIPLYAVAFIAFIHPTFFAGFSTAARQRTLLIIAINIVAFPLLATFLLSKLGFIQSFFLHTQKDRIIPYIITGIFFFWGYQVFKNQHHYPSIVKQFLFAIFLAVSAANIANIYFKISMHAIGMGGLVGLGLVIAKTNTMVMSWPLALFILLAGLVCTARFIVSNHTQKEVYTGLVLGIVCQYIAYYFI